ncbi:glycosyltransferase family 2 protein [Cobetia marina]
MPSSTAMPTPSSPHVSAQEDSSSEGISVLIPGRDERDNLPKLIAEVHAALAGRRYEIIVVDDGSSDDSWRWLTQAALEDSRLRPYHHDTSFGQSTSLWQAARLARGEWLATLDGDGQNDPADLPDMLSLASLEGLDMVAGHRTERRDDAVKRVSSRLANAIRQALLHDDTPDPAAASRSHVVTSSCVCRISITCTVSCLRWCGPRAARCSPCRYAIVSVSPGFPSTASSIDCGSASATSSA